MAKPGRKPKIIYDSQLLRDIKEYASKGMNETQIAEILGISRKKFWLWKKEHRAIVNVITRGKNELVSKAPNVVNDALNDGDVGTAKWVLERRGGKDWKQEIDISVSAKPMIIKRFNPEDGEKILGLSDGIEDAEYEDVTNEDETRS